MSQEPTDESRAYWKANKRLIIQLLSVWAFVSYGCGILFVEALNKIQFFGVPFGFWMAHQGAIYVFIALIFIYAKRMDVIDRKYHKDDAASEGESK
jgi:putative solute:sodium symporter small subunit